jgi:DNA repair protein RecN (Recombination protein N)
LIETLRIENVAILERTELEFGPGLNVLTGETGAGKSIVLGALALLAGGRASSDAIRDGAEAATVEAVFGTEALPDLEAALAERGLAADGHDLIVQRTLARTGRSRARVSGQLVPVALLSELLGGRVEISSQHESQALLRPEVQGWLLDRMGELLELRGAVAEGHAELRALDRELDRLRAQARERAQRQDFLSFQVREIDEAKLDPGAVAELEGRHARLAHAERLREEGGQALRALGGDPLGGEADNAADRLGEAARRIEGLGRLDPALAGWGERLVALQSEVREAALDLERYLDGIEADPAYLADLDQQIQRVEELRRKYGASVEEILRFRDEAAAELASIEGADEREAAIGREREERAGRLLDAARILSAGRRKAGRRLARAVQGSLRDLGMPEARFEVALEALEPPDGAPCGPTGLELPEFRLSANAGEALRPFRKVASGGELSRAFLAVQGALRGSAGGMVLVFDEVDAGVGGRAADRVGRALAELAEHHQVLCITHLPQIAAFAHRHFRVEKATRRGRTLARIGPVEGAERVKELARMAGGEAVGEATLRHARELLAARSPLPQP